MMSDRHPLEIAFTLGISLLATAAPACAQVTNDPFPEPIAATEGVIRVDFVEFASLPDIDGEPARMIHLVDEPGTGRLFVNDMRGPLYSLSYDGQTVMEYIDINAADWDVHVNAASRETGFQGFSFHPQFDQPDTPGYGKFYTWTDSSNTGPDPDYVPSGDGDSHDTVLHEWTASNPEAAHYDGGAPRELLRVQQPFGNHNGGQIGFNPLAAPSDPDFGLLYVSLADGGSGGDPYNMAQDLSSAFGKLLRIDPHGSDSANGEYAIPAENPFAGDGDADTLGEIFAYGIRNGQHFAWDPVNGNLFLSDIGQNVVEKLTLVTPGANLGWNAWEGSFRFSGGAVDVGNPRSDPEVTYPVVEWAHQDPLLPGRSAASGLHVYRSDEIPQLENLVLFGDLPSGELFSISADDLPSGGQDPIRRVLFNDEGEAKTLLQLIQEKNRSQGRTPASRADLRFDGSSSNEVFLLNKHDGTIRQLVP
ncbi:MAG: PQQ-dependent sugar dehydrogenase [Pseudohongiellaceae bacterium]